LRLREVQAAVPAVMPAGAAAFLSCNVFQGVIVSEPDFVKPPRVPPIFAVVLAVTAFVVTVNVAVELPAATVTEAGTTAEVLELESATTAPPAGAALVSLTVPAALVPPFTLDGVTVTDVRPTIVSVSEMVFPEKTPLMLGLAVHSAACVAMGNVADELPAGTVTLAGTAASELLEDSVTTKPPPAGAFPRNRTVPIDGLPPATVAGLTVRLS
jgi:hypothetical protein